MAVGIALAEVEVLGEEALRRVVVRIENDRREMQLLGALGDFIARRNLNWNVQDKKRKKQVSKHAAGSHSFPQEI